MENKRKQLAFDITPELHMAIKISAVKRGISISNWINRAINDRLKKEDRDEIRESE